MIIQCPISSSYSDVGTKEERKFSSKLIHGNLVLREYTAKNTGRRAERLPNILTQVLQTRNPDSVMRPDPGNTDQERISCVV